MKKQQWPTDPTFRAFAAKVADGVTLAMARGYKIESCHNQNLFSERDCCPLGAVALELYSEEGNWIAARYPCRIDGQGSAFVSGFENVAGERLWRDEWRPYYRLGAEYRKRFVTGAQ